mmetsp:Transcript_4922/g.6499  ORF Transcript_4922/g.6499 Transcript_4922/m.6499 type:complete len:164 (-) Transcript_4922:362-853(-)
MYSKPVSTPYGEGLCDYTRDGMAVVQLPYGVGYMPTHTVQRKVASIPVATSYGKGLCLGEDAGGMLRVQLKFGVAYVHRENVKEIITPYGKGTLVGISNDMAVVELPYGRGYLPPHSAKYMIADTVNTAYGKGKADSKDAVGIMRVALKFGTAYIHEANVRDN